jgi:hypothetical protein
MRTLAMIVVLALPLVACNQNTAIGNDRESQLEPAPTPAPIMAAAPALENIATAIIKPETMSGVDIEALGGKRGRCAVKLTEVGFPSFLYEPDGPGAIKLNGKLIVLPNTGEGRYEDGGLIVTLRSVDATGNAGLQAMDMIVVPPQSSDEIGYRGYVQCYEGAAT